MFIFDKNKLIYLLEKLKFQFDKKVNKTQVVKIVEAGAVNALEVVDANPTDNQIAIDDVRLDGSGAVIGDNVVLTDGVLSEENFTLEEKALLKEIIDQGGFEEIINNRLDGHSLYFCDKEQYDDLVNNGEIKDDVVYIVIDDDDLPVIDSSSFVTKEQINEISSNKVSYICRVNENEEGTLKVVASGTVTDDTKEIAIDDLRIVNEGFVEGEFIHLKKSMVLSETNYDDKEYEAIQKIKEIGPENFLTINDIADNLITDDSVENHERLVLSANQGRILEQEYLDQKKNVYLTQEEFDALTEEIPNTIYHIINAESLIGLTEEQVEMLNKVHVHTLIDYSMLYASKDDIYNARTNNKGVSFRTLSERIDAIENLLLDILYNSNNG